MNISVILPTYCEAGNIGRLVEAIETKLASSEWNIEIIVVDDNSPDGTAQEVGKVQPLPGVTITCLVRTQERGLATAIKYGIQHSSGEIVLVMDTDFNHSPDNLPAMIENIRQFDMVIGSRFVRGGGMEDRLRYFCSALFNLFIRIILRNPIHDNLCGYFAIHRDKLMNLDLDTIFTGYGEYFIRLVSLAQHAGLTIKEIPVFYSLRTSGESKSQFGSMIWNYAGTTFSLLGRKSKIK
jgi:dolichol-phosphate mannosyltransferase